MFPQQPQQQFSKAGADVQIFYGAGGTVAQNQRTWNKPVGVSHVYMMLIGGGGTSDGTFGGSGAVTVWYGAAQHVPNSLVVSPSRGDSNNTTVSARFSNSTAAPTALLTANAGSTGAGAAMAANQFTASGFYQSVAGSSGGLSATTFLTGWFDVFATGAANYGYLTNPGGAQNSANGYFQLQPIIVGAAGVGSGRASIGCSSAVAGGPGMVLIASW